jgi:hypothetical protein
MQNVEQFRPVLGFEGKYEVSNHGRVKALNYHRENREALLTGAVDRYGYRKVTFCLQAKQTTHMVHRLVAEAFLPTPTTSANTVNHIDGNKANNSASNLEWLSVSDNVKHAYATGLADSKGSKSGMSKLTDEDVLQIRSSYAVAPTEAIAKQFNISQATIHKIASGATWAHLPLTDYSGRKARIDKPYTGFVEAAIKAHGEGRYDYSQVEYIDSKTPVTIICELHGPFKQKPKGHTMGQGCQKCAVIQRQVSLANKKTA